MPTVTSKDGTTIAFDKTGEGPALLLVDGALCFRSFGPMTPLAELLKQHFTVYTYDRRGRGESSDTLPYAVDREVEDIEAVIDAAGGSAFVYAISSGAVLALEAARQLPDKIRKMALYEAPLGDVAQQDAQAYTEKLSETLSAGRKGDAVELFMTRVNTPAEAIAGMKHAPVWQVFEAVAPTLAYDNALLGDGSVPTERAASVRMPTLVMAGGASVPFMRTTAQALADAIPNAQYRSLEGQTHQVDATVIAPVLVEFFAG